MFGYWADQKFDYNTVLGMNETDGMPTTVMVSNPSYIQFWDIVFLWAQAMVAFGFYLDLASIVDPRLAKFIGKDTNQVDVAKEADVEDDDTDGDEL